MKFKIAVTLTLLVLVSLLSFSNRCRPDCDGRKMVVMGTAFEAEASVNIPLEEPAGHSPLLRMAITL